MGGRATRVVVVVVVLPRNRSHAFAAISAAILTFPASSAACLSVSRSRSPPVEKSVGRLVGWSVGLVAEMGDCRRKSALESGCDCCDCKGGWTAEGIEYASTVWVANCVQDMDKVTRLGGTNAGMKQ
uniref:Secreted protein n=1 Tax=Peronospora matthiolae TaxID=2874970 RepID=A0AAV1V4P9_9STRA